MIWCIIDRNVRIHTFPKRWSFVWGAFFLWVSLRSAVWRTLRTAAFIRCYFDTINLKQSVFCRTNSFKILVSERKYIIISNIVNLKKIYFIILMYNVFIVMFYYKTLWFYQDFKSENLCFSEAVAQRCFEKKCS